MRFLKVILPPLVAFLVFAVIIKYNPLHHSFEGLSDIGDGSASGLITYYKIFAPFQFVIAVLTQYLIILPLWDKILRKGRTAITIFIVMAIVCLLLAFGIAYMIWDRAAGTEHLIHITLFMAGVQVFYWAINFVVLFLFDIKSVTKSNVPADEAESA